jgi:hypothetical protein
LKKKRVRNDPAMWIRAQEVFPAVVDNGLFEAAQTIIRERAFRMSDGEMLEALRGLFQTQGLLSGLIIDETDGLPSSSSYRSRFGTLLRAYSLVGYRPRRDYRYIAINRALRQMYPHVIDEVAGGFTAVGAHIAREADDDLLTINGELSVSIVVVRCRQTQTGSLRWNIRFDTGVAPDITVAVRMDRANEKPLDFYLFPRIDRASADVRLAEENGLSLDAYRFETLDPLYHLAERVRIPEAA